MNRILIVFCCFIMLLACEETTDLNSIKISNINELNEAIKNCQAGDEIVLANGIWNDVQIEFYGKGTKEKPIVLRAETKGEVTIEGKSNLKLGGEYLEVNGLYFKNGYTPSNSVIQFKINNDSIANHCRVTNCVIEEFTQPDRDVSDHWIELWGSHKNC